MQVAPVSAGFGLGGRRGGSSATSPNAAGSLSTAFDSRLALNAVDQRCGSNVLVWQRQLRAQRALLKRENVFILMDEATANVDAVAGPGTTRCCSGEVCGRTRWSRSRTGLHTVAAYGVGLVMARVHVMEMGQPRRFSSVETACSIIWWYIAQL
ncbi:multidrug resistance protein, putative [Leishmania tarentolae]|uniref:Multidrug resistance protein, putative n=1 Tax=Leishmania tarentolae TaxID=5689 RepID=A0A640KNS6_LEITA|nr:multidrug resistance protein, putative [Leishmania tarentolae]